MEGLVALTQLTRLRRQCDGQLRSPVTTNLCCLQGSCLRYRCAPRGAVGPMQRLRPPLQLDFGKEYADLARLDAPLGVAAMHGD